MRTFFFVLFFLYSCAGAGQGLNNNYEYDQKDIGKLFEMNNMGVFKFRLLLKDSNNAYNIIIFFYKNGALEDSFNLITQMSGVLKKYGKENVPLPEAQKGADNLLRIYSKLAKDTLIFDISLNDYSIRQTFDFNEVTTGSRAFVTNLEDIKSRTRVMAFYGVKKGILHCAMNDSDEVLKKRMDEIAIIYLEPTTY